MYPKIYAFLLQNILPWRRYREITDNDTVFWFLHHERKNTLRISVCTVFVMDGSNRVSWNVYWMMHWNICRISLYWPGYKIMMSWNVYRFPLHWNVLRCRNPFIAQECPEMFIVFSGLNCLYDINVLEYDIL